MCMKITREQGLKILDHKNDPSPDDYTAIEGGYWHFGGWLLSISFPEGPGVWELCGNVPQDIIDLVS